MRTLTGEICLTQRRVSATAYDDYRARVEETIKSDPKTFFGYVDLKNKRVGYRSVMHFEGRLVSGPEEICDLFVKFIQRTYTDVAGWPSYPGTEPVLDDSPFGALQFTSDEVESFLQDLDVNKGSGPDGIPPIILKSCASAFAKPLALLFNKSMANGVFSNKWKVSYVILRYSRKVGVTTLRTIVP
jgi:hypothetical protein